MSTSFLQRILGYASNQEQCALVDRNGAWSYRRLLQTALAVQRQFPVKDVRGARVAFLCPNDALYVATLWSIWLAGGVAVPLSRLHTPAELAYFIDHTACAFVVVYTEYAALLPPLKDTPALIVDSKQPPGETDSGLDAATLAILAEQKAPALIIYTSGTTSKPKGVVHTHASLQAQCESMSQAWGWSSTDSLLHVLPLHHIHGIVNALLCTHWNGGSVQMLERFEADKVWSYIQDPPRPLTVLTAVPTMYAKLAERFGQLSETEQGVARHACRQFRLMMSGSSALSKQLLARWEHISGHQLLERYGLTETGMVLSTRLGEARLQAETVGQPMPLLSVALASREEEGEVWVKGPTLFCQYWQNEAATSQAFTEQGYFQTGDLARIASNGEYQILGRQNTDIIKRGGYKISALEIERRLLDHPEIQDCAVVGIPDDVYGETIVAVVVATQPVPEPQLRSWLASSLAKYKLPSLFKLVNTNLPKTAMGKVNKKALVRDLQL